MQTFLPYPDFRRSLAALDQSRLGKQRLEAWQLLRRVSGEIIDNYSNHPAAVMWRVNEGALRVYYNTALYEWERRGFHNHLLQPVEADGASPLPVWIGCPAFHRSHQRLLAWKNPSHYPWKAPSEYPDKIWPCNRDGSYHPAVALWLQKKGF